MLPNEEENIRCLHERYASHFEAASEMSDLAQRILALWKTKVDGKATAADIVTNGLLTQAIIRYRSIAVLCERGHFTDAEILTRSMFETVLAIRFVLAPRSSCVDWSHELKRALARRPPIPAGKEIHDFHAELYAAHDALKLHWKAAEMAAVISRYGPLPDDFGDKVAQLVSEIEAEIGAAWVKLLKDTRSYSGLNILQLSEYCGLLDYYKTMWRLQSGKAHGGGAVEVLQGIDGTKLPQILKLPAGVLGQALEIVDQYYGLGMAEEVGRFAASFHEKTPV